ncbi:MAG: MarR family transcriptional regulator [Bacteroidota bacterium]
MSLEEDIGQRKFSSARQKALINILYTSNFITAKMNDVFKQYDITKQQYNVLRILRGAHPKSLSINCIKERMLDKMSDASRIVERLHKKGLIKRLVNKKDRRTADVKIKKSGLELLQRSDPAIQEFERFLDNLNDAEIKDINLCLDKVREAKKASFNPEI